MSYEMHKAKNVASEKLHEATDAVGLGHGGSYSNVDSTHKVHQHNHAHRRHCAGLFSCGNKLKQKSKIKSKERVATHQHGYY